ncbi:LOW QUALITY PROTEIN: hypothetical protein TorRG33x02_128450 [Trema orientale]|uniref:Transmembrane protein n=1 Tax=Trema orientale TaxID=63057 RepID=A0A2P5F0G6_TREOI|nr:LOW QUALITY PROTEIN: hypothetical protein TorRG33x02_128450 [Trema orientale]
MELPFKCGRIAPGFRFIVFVIPLLMDFCYMSSLCLRRMISKFFVSFFGTFGRSETSSSMTPFVGIQ